MLGINNTWAAEEPVVDSVFAGVQAVLEALHARKPKARIILQSLLPTMEPAKNAQVVRTVNQRLQALAASAAFAGFTTWLDLYPSFVNAAGEQIGEDFNDGLHPNAAGYHVWRDRLLPALRSARANP